MSFKVLLTWLSAIGALWLLRCVVAGQSPIYYSFIVWNVFLAAVPLLLGPLFGLAKAKLAGLGRKTAQGLVALAWLLFLPNAFYVLTDFMHLNAAVLVNRRDDGHLHLLHYGRGDGLYVLDSLLVFAAVVVSAYFGALALLQAYRFFVSKFNQKAAYACTGALMLAVSVGVYIGRYGRWNSWDGLIRPWNVAADLLDVLSRPALRERLALVVLTMLIFQVLSVLVVNRLKTDT